MSAFTAKSYQLGRAPKRITLLGDRTKRPESAQHIIEFPGGAIELSRTEGNLYWAHIIVNRGFAHPDQDGLAAALGEVAGARIDSAAGVLDVPNAETLSQIAVLVRAVPMEELTRHG